MLFFGTEIFYVTCLVFFLSKAASDFVRYGKLLHEESAAQLQETGCTFEQCLDYFGLYIKVVREFSRSDPKEFITKMTNLGYSGEFIDRCLSQLSPQQPHSKVVIIDKLTAFKWRLDVSFSDRL